MSQAHHSTGHSEVLVQTDADIERDRLSRAIVAIVSPPIAFSALYLFGESTALWLDLPVLLGEMVGTAVGALTSVWMISRSYIKNDPFVAFMTSNPIVSLFGIEGVYETYGPETHLCFWFEQRNKVNTVNLKEDTVEFLLDVQGVHGTFRVSGSARIRPDIRFIPNYLSGAGTIVGEIIDLIRNDVSKDLHPKKVPEAIASVDGLNELLTIKFKHGETGIAQFEERFGVMVGDITITNIEPSEEVKKALDGAAEGDALNLITARSFGCKSVKEMHAAVKAGRITHEQVSIAFKLAMAFTNNLHGMEFGDKTYNVKISGLENVDPKLASAVAEAVKAYTAMNAGEQTPAPKKKRGST